MGTTHSRNRKKRKSYTKNIPPKAQTKIVHRSQNHDIDADNVHKTTLCKLKRIALQQGYWECDKCCFINSPSSWNCMVCQLLLGTTKQSAQMSIIPAETETTTHFRFKWQFLAKTNRWSDLDTRTCKQLDNLRVNKSTHYCFGAFTYTVYKVSDIKCIQINNKTHVQRQLRRTRIDDNIVEGLSKGSIYFQYQSYTVSQMEIISAAFSDKLEQYPLTLVCTGFWRSNGHSSLASLVCQLCEGYLDTQYTSNALGYDGLPKLVMGYHCLAHYCESKLVHRISAGCKISDGFEKWSASVRKEFDVLKCNLLRSGDIVIPIPTRDELRKNSVLYYKNGRGKQAINHTIGTGNALMPFGHRLFIQQQIDELTHYAQNVSVVAQQLFL